MYTMHEVKVGHWFLNTLPGSFKQNVLVPFGKSKESTVSLPDSSEKNYKENKLLPGVLFNE